MNVPNSPDAATKVQEDAYMEYELQKFWGSISGDPNAEPEDRERHCCTKEELFIMFCASQGRPVNLAPFILANFDRVIENPNRRICIGNFVTLLARAI
ncbi:hypothetical protein A2U01_0050066, partial [Trifolium medium]|nr:hypothetical protein [Trifolium medium]